MKQIATATFITAFALNAYAAPEKFAGASFGHTITSVEATTALGSDDDRTDASSTYSLAFGLKDRAYRVYVDVSYEDSEISNTSTLGFNADYIYPVMNQVGLFAGAIIGHATTNWDEDNTTVKALGLDGDSDDSFVYGAKLGATYTVIPNADIEFGVRHLFSDLKSDKDGSSLEAQESTNTYLGVTYKF